MTKDTVFPMNEAELKAALKSMIIVECDKEEVSPEEIGDDDLLIGGPLELDSLDALQICLAVQRTWGVRIAPGPDARKSLRSVNALCETIVSRISTASI